MEFIFGRAGAALLSPCHGERQDVRRRRVANKPPQAVPFSCHGVSAAAGSAIFVSRQNVHRGQCDSRATASLPPRAVPFSCHGKMYAAGSAILVPRQNVRCGRVAAGSAIFLSRQDVHRGQCHFLITAKCTLRAGRKHTAAPSGYAGFRRLSASIQNACPRKARASGILNRFAAPSIPHAALTTTKTAQKL